MISNGQFGQVREGMTKLKRSVTEANHLHGNTRQMKLIREDTSLLLNLSHPNVFIALRSIGKTVVPWSFFEFPEDQRNLRKYMFSNRTTENQLLSWCHDICKGMEFLHSRNILHRGLSARSVFLSKDERTVKISYLETAVQPMRDAVVTYSNSGFAVDAPASAMKSARFNAHHVPRECLLGGKFTTASDVWSFGMTMLELFNSGLNPYKGMKQKRIKAWIVEGKSPMSFVELEITQEIELLLLKPAVRVHPELRHSFVTLGETFVALKRRDFPCEVLSGMEKLRFMMTSTHPFEPVFSRYFLTRRVELWGKILKTVLQKRVLPAYE